MNSKTAFFPCREYDNIFKFFRKGIIIVGGHDE